MPGPEKNPAESALFGMGMLSVGNPQGACGLPFNSSKYQCSTFARASLIKVELIVRVQRSVAVSCWASVLKVLYWRPSTQPPGRKVFKKGERKTTKEIVSLLVAL